jgi:polysaccharide chain length determinant protein (PEP-CTERM system associated)
MIPGKQFRIEDGLAAFSRQKWMILVPLIVVAGLTAVVALVLPSEYQSEAVILVVPQRVPETYIQSTVTNSVSDRLQSISEQILSRTALERVIEEFKLYPTLRQYEIMEDIVGSMRKNIQLDITRSNSKTGKSMSNDSSFRIAYSYTDPQTAMRVTERLASLFIDENLRDRQVLAEGTNQFIEAQLEDARQRLVAQERKLADYNQQHSGELPSQTQSNLQVLQNTQLQLSTLSEGIARDRDRRMMLEQILEDSAVNELAATSRVGVAPAALQASGDRRTRPQTATEELQAARAELAVQSTRLKAEHPDILRLKRHIGDLEAKVEAEAKLPPSAAPAAVVPVTAIDLARAQKLAEQRAEVQGLASEIARKQEQQQKLTAVLEQYQHRLEALPARQTELVELQRDHDTLQKSYSQLLVKKEESKMSADLERRQIGEQFKVIDPARLPEKPVRPNRPLIDLLGAVGGLGLGIAIGAWREYKDSSLRTDTDVLLALALPVLAMIPTMTSMAERRSKRRRQLVLAVAASTLVVALIGVVAVSAWKH